MKQTTIMAVVLGVLLLVSAVQAFQLNSIKSDLAGSDFSVKAASSSQAPGASGGTSGAPAALPSSINNLPQMVGGC
ncbi:TPA: hypothetical protein HA361_01385 [Candidatus Woesearchaeota archaeon]|nr:hypothetical protein [Candidatus Woesearchaeota archaeon]HII68426.1 hypothetical protein [Candidatus Woesearchaeota archaeon]